MSLNISQLIDYIAGKYSDVEQIDETILCYKRKDGDRPFAVCYIDINPNLPKSHDELLQYQDQVIGKRYFEKWKSLQWNNYLYFILNNSLLETGEVQHAKKLIEGDRTYARKYVIAEEELDEIFSHNIDTNHSNTPTSNILSIWERILINGNIDGAIFCNENMPNRIKKIINGTSNSSSGSSNITSRSSAVENQSTCINELKINNFRKYPTHNSFKFGKVNLIFGANGSGKTTLLEAIELIFCGKNRRNSNVDPQYNILFKDANNLSYTADSNRDKKLFRNRNLAWYGKSEIKTNNLCHSFAQFNFLDADAAVRFADSNSDIKDDLSKLIVGSEASKVWLNINNVAKAVKQELRGLIPQASQIKEELKTIIVQLTDAKNNKSESTQIYSKLQDMLQLLEWSIPSEQNNNVKIGKIVESLSEIVSIAHQATDLNWLSSPVSIDVIKNFISFNLNEISKVESEIDKLTEYIQKQKLLQNDIQSNTKLLNVLKKTSTIILSGVPEKSAQLGRLKTISENLEILLDGIDERASDTDLFTDGTTITLDFSFSDVELNININKFKEISIKQEEETLLQYEEAKNSYTDFCRLRDQSINLYQQLRNIASKILVSSPNHDECPLCHHKYKSGELGRHIERGLDKEIEETGLSFLNNMNQYEDVYKKQTMTSHKISILSSFAQKTITFPEPTVRDVLQKVDEIRKEIKDNKLKAKSIEDKLNEFETLGLSLDTYTTYVDEIKALGYNSTSEFTVEFISEIHSDVTANLDETKNCYDDMKKISSELLISIQESLKIDSSDPNELKSELFRLKERNATTNAILNKLTNHLVQFPWSSTKPIADLVVEAKSVQKLSTYFLSVLEREEQIDTTSKKLIARKNILLEKQSKMQPKVDRLKESESLLEGLIRENSLSGAMSEMLANNKQRIEKIFSQIHSPAEFSKLGNSWNKLIRKIDGTESKLSEISTGQRSAFALSVFLAQNEQLSEAPPVILIDDPVAHVDDLNSLSFLDYLREIVLTGKRQIFFATADEKLASLFTRKFDFLGEKSFSRINLERNS